MKTIDHRVIIPAPADLVWDVISDIRRNPEWQADCRDVVFLTSLRQGPGLRWRYSTPRGREYVVEVSAWYNGLGYEYFYVDGPGFKEARGRIRVQETPDGTVVQWTFTYQFSGLMGGSSRQLDDTIAQSLIQLYDQLKKQTRGFDEREAKSLIREAPDVEARAAYKPRHPSPADGDTDKPGTAPRGAAASFERVEADEPIFPSVSESAQQVQPSAVIPEPPVEKDDTRPNRFAPPPARAQTPATGEVAPNAVPADVEGEPDFLSAIDDLLRFEPPHDPVNDTQPRATFTPPPTAAPIAPASIEAAPPPEPYRPWARRPEAASETAPGVEEEAAPPEQPAPATELEREADESVVSAPTEPEVASTFAHEPEPDEEATPARATVQPPVTDDARTAEELTPIQDEVEQPTPEPDTLDTDSRSIWEIFGVQRPEDDLETVAAATMTVTPEDEELAEPEHSVESPVESAVDVQPPVSVIRLQPLTTRTGLRLLLRRHAARVRRP